MLVLLSEEPGSDICSFSTVDEDSRGSGKRSGDDDGFRILKVVDDDLEIVERAAAMLLLFWPEIEAAAIATSRESGLMVVWLEC